MIPKKIYQSWKTKKLDPGVQKNVDNMRAMNPEYEYELFDDNDCRSFLLENFGKAYAKAFDTVLPGAFKCDFWRYCVLYVNGGVYLDIDLVELIPLRDMIKDTDEFVSVVDRYNPLEVSCCGVYQAFIACTPKHPILKYALELCFANIVTRREEIFEFLSSTGPILMGIAVNLNWKRKNPYAKIYPGRYDNGVVLYKLKQDLVVANTSDENIFKHKLEEYDYGSVPYKYQKMYTDDPGLKARQYVKIVILSIIIVALISLIVFLIYRRKYKNCVQSCPVSVRSDV